MEAPALTDLTRCHVGVGPDPDRVGLVVDYRGDHPPIELFEMLRRYEWLTPAPHAPPASAIDWDHPDPTTGRRWSLRPFLVVGAIAVPGPAAPDWSTTADWLTGVVEGCGLVLSSEPLDIGIVREPRQGLVEVVFDHVDVPVDPFQQHAPAATVAQPAEPGSTTESVPNTAHQGQHPADASIEPGVGLPSIDVAERALPSVENLSAAEPTDSTSTPLVWTAEDPVLHQRTVWAVIRRAVLGQVVQLLHDMDVEEDAVLLPVTGWGRGGGLVTRYRGVVSVEPLQRVQLQVAVDPSLVDELTARLVDVARIGDKGDGKIWVT